MPLYEYQCASCGHRFELIQKFSDPPADTCPRCGGPVQKLIASPAFQFKGTGWYITDYAKKDPAGTGKPGESTSGEASSEKSDKPTSTPDKATTGESTSGGAAAAPAAATKKDAGA